MEAGIEKMNSYQVWEMEKWINHILHDD